MIWRVFKSGCYQRSSSLIKSVVFNSIESIKMPFYAVAKGRTAGIYMTWPDCESQVKGFPGARYKKFNTVVEAQDFITNINSGSSTHINKQPNNVPKSSVNNLKRPYSTSNQNDKNNKLPSKKSKSKAASFDSDDSLDSDLNTILIKQMDDIEKRLKGFGKGVDNIIKKNTKTVQRKSILIEPLGLQDNRNLNNNFMEDKDGYVQVYTDGACSSNGKSGARAGLGVYWGEGHALNTSEPVSGRATNNCGEIQAATRAIQLALDNGVKKLMINTDSQFLINSVTKWMPGWKRKGWKLKSGEPVKNERDFKELDSIQNRLQIKWNYVPGHNGVHGNEMADRLAREGAAMYDR